jgi:hypothetical protein
MRDRLPLILSTTALVVAVLGATPLGHAAAKIVPVPLAKRAYLADTAKNSVKLNNIKANRTPTAGQILPLDQTGKFPTSVGAIGPKGDKGSKGGKGTKGDPGLSGYELVTKSFTVNGNTLLSAGVQCPTGKKVLGGAAQGQGGPKDVPISTNIVLSSYQANALNTTATPKAVSIYAVCATVAP